MLDDSGVIYIITNKINGKQYVGQAVCYSGNRPWGSERRWQSHVKNAKNNKCECRLLENSIRKYGEKQFVVEDVLECGLHELNIFEKQYIEEYKTLTPFGYNLMTGGGNGRLHSKETKKKMSETRTGKQHTETTKQRIGNSNKGLTVDEIGRYNIGKASKYRNMSDTNKKLLDDALSEIGIENLPMYVSLSIDKRCERNVEQIIVRHPNYPHKKFGKKNMSLADKIRQAISYRNGHRSEGSPQPQ